MTVTDPRSEIIAAPSRERFQLATAFGEAPEVARDLARRLDPEPAAHWVADRAMESVFPDRLSDSLFRESIFKSSLDNIDMMWRIIAGRAELNATPPIGALAFAEVAAEVGVPVSQLERVYRVGIGIVWIAWYREASAYAQRTGCGLAPLLEVPTMVIHSYIDHLLMPVTERFDATRAEARRTRDQLRRSILRAALGGAAVLAEPESAEALGITASGEQVAFAARGVRVSQRDLAEYARQAARATIALPFRHATDTWLIWLWRPDRFTPADLRGLAEALARSDAAVAISEIGSGAAGLGATGREALEAARLQALIGEDAQVLRFADVRLESLLSAQPEQAGRFVEAELCGLAEDSTRAHDLRETAMVWLSTGSNVATAARLGLHEHTVRNRIAQAEQLLGHALAERRTELLVALRLRRMLGPRQHEG